MLKKKICLVSAEAVPFIKIGGMADVVGSLYKYLKSKNDVYLFLPLYKEIRLKHQVEEIADIEVYFHEGRKEPGKIARSAAHPNIYFVYNPDYFDREDTYGSEGKDYADNLARFSFFSRGVLESLKKLDISPDIFHCNDWHTALLPLYLKEFYRDDFPSSKTLFTIHNLAYQGLFPRESFSILGLPWEYYDMNQLEFYGGINIMKAGIIHSDLINTVSKKYADEILSPEFGGNLEGLLKNRKSSLMGILNGIDYQVWNPGFDSMITKKYRTLKSKEENKLYLQKTLGLSVNKETPLFGIVTRLAGQKGLDDVIAIMDELASKNIGMAILGKGEAQIENRLIDYSSRYPNKISVTLGFNETLAHQIYAGADFFLMPSRFEPCGLGQLIAFKYGTIPVVRRVGGLSDTVQNYNFKTEEGTGITFEESGDKRLNTQELLSAIEKAIDLFYKRDKREKLVHAVMQLDFSWKSSVNEYIEIYNSLSNTDN